MTEPLDIPCIIRLLRDAHRPLDLAALMDDAAMAMTRMEIAIKAFLREYDAACNEGHTMRLDELAKMMQEAIE